MSRSNAPGMSDEPIVKDASPIVLDPSPVVKYRCAARTLVAS